MVRKDTEKDFQIRIRNLTYNENVYQVSVDEQKQILVVSTSNKKYYKQIQIGDMQRANIKLQNAQSNVQYYIRENLWQTLQKYCNEQYKAIGDPSFVFWKAFGLFQEGSPNEAINELTQIYHKKEIQYASIIALIYYHQSCQSVDREALQNLKFEEQAERRLTNDKALCLASLFYSYSGEHRKSKELLDDIQSQGINSRIAQAWSFLLEGSTKNVDKAIELFEALYNEQNDQNKNIESLMGRAKANELKRKFEVTLNTLNEIIVLYTDFKSVQIEKAKFLMILGNWEQLQESVSQILYDEPNNIIALQLQAFITFIREGDIELGCEKLDILIKVIQKQEQKNTQLMHKVAQLFSRISGKNKQILNTTLNLCLQCKKSNPLNANYASELAVQYLMLNDYEKAYGLFQEAAALDETKIDCLIGMIQCRLYQGVIEDAEQQIEFLNQINSQEERTPEIAYLEYLLASKKTQNDPKGTIRFVDEALKLHIQSTKLLSPNFEYYIQLNPNFLLQLSQAYLSQIGMKEMLSGNQPSNGSVAKGTKLLDTITKQIPGLVSAYLLLAKGKMSLGQQSDALKSINKVIEFDSKNEEAYVLSALIASQSKNYSLAQNNLQQAISNNFMIRENPLFMLVKGEVEYAMGNFLNCEQTMEAAYEIPEVKDQNIQKNSNNQQQILQFGEKDRCQIFLLYAKALSKNNKAKDAKKIMNLAIGQFANTPEEVNVFIANSEIAINSGDVKKAISILKGVQQDSPYFLRAKQILADVYLEQLRDKRNYAKCYTDMVDLDQSFENYKLLGDALVKIREMEDAAKAYEKAAILKPEDQEIIRLLGSSLCQTHDFQRALDYYENALGQNPKRIDLILGLGQLCIQIKNFKRAEQVLRPEVFTLDEYQEKSFSVLKKNMQGFYLIAKLHLKKQTPNEIKPIEMYRKAIKKAIQLQTEVIEKAKQESEDVENERKYIGQLFLELAKYTIKYERNEQAALAILQECNKYVQDQENVLELEAEIYLNGGQKADCENKCNILLKLNANNDFASLTLAELLLQKNDYSQAIEQFKKILQDRPNNYGILSKLIDFFRRTFQIQQANAYIERAEKKATNKNDPGLCYCKALFYKYNRQIYKQYISKFKINKKKKYYLFQIFNKKKQK
ncbi:tetratricopeptide repeat protein [Ichthyophthirius multifiliis]|uniref:Tetratricopeptide repeat protein n=1 Tax=Ichthyophthirius multifiliis TaxID=5932 RepID=G0QSE3_ICHMU|nr:tetratricopeptide repeat protein [Ichthyophthirius multifiliis]EGR31890.1 tetratricopeptide repeat protein [Ichthyophthirius multifiliis]|eukprot:XP_004035376.1 tetratricopeptide repeat protein [Ichthyophthirius multifiliis]